MEFERLYKGERIEGKLKSFPEDFIVEEKPDRKDVYSLDKTYEFEENSEGKFLHCILIKREVDTFEAIDVLRRKLRLKEDAITFAGLKDKLAITTQKIGLYKVRKEDVENLSFKKMKIIPIKYGKKVYLGSLWGNRFTITIRDVNVDKLKNVFEDYFEKTGGLFPNYFGEQRFGSLREITHLVGKCIVKKDFEKAVMMYIALWDEKDKSCCDWRSEVNKLLKEGRFEEALELMPKKYSHERILIKGLMDFKDPKKAFLLLPKKVQVFFINSYQSYIFNRTLERVVKMGHIDEKLSLPIIGADYSKKVMKTWVDEIVEEILEEEGVKPEDFIFKEKHLLTTTRYRKAYGKVHDFEILDVNYDEKWVKIRFSLRKSIYATTFLKEVLDYRVC